MARLRAPSVLLLPIIAAGPAPGLARADCASCCSAMEERAPRLSALACCGDGCAEQLAAGKDNPVLTSTAPAVLKSPALTTIVASLLPVCACFDRVSSRILWLPASAPPGTVPLRL